MESENKNLVKQSDNAQKSFTRIKPRYGVWTKKDKMVLQVALPGIQKDQISMKAIDDYFTLRAYRNNIEYVLDLDFGVKIEPEKTEAQYNEGLLKIEFERYKPLEHSYEVPIQ